MKNKVIIAILVLSFGLFSCEKDKFESDKSNTTTEEQPHKVSDGIVVLGEKINDPYAIYNMKAAYSNLKSAGKDAPIDEIQPNKKYLRFLPKNEAEWDLLKSDTSIILYDFPLDYEIEINGTYYHDPELPDTAVTWQYCVVPIDKDVPNIQHELLYEVFIPNFDNLELDTTLKSASTTNNFYEQLVYESYKLTGNINESDDNLKSTKGWNPFKPKRWHPAGRITVADDLLGTIPLEGANVHARWLTHIEDDITDSDGRFRMGGFIYKVNYSIKWDRYHYSIRNGNVGQAWYNRSGRHKGDWNLHITGGKSKFYAEIHKAAHHYYYKSIQNLRRPPGNGFWHPQMKIGAHYEENSSYGVHKEERRFFGVNTWVRIYRPSEASDVTYGSTIHELAHAAHWGMVRGDFDKTDGIVKESWASGVEWALTRMVYSSYNINYFTSTGSNYTRVVVDLVDGRSGYDQVENYTMRQIEDALDGAKTFNKWRDNLKNKFTNGTEDNVDNLFNYWD